MREVLGLARDLPRVWQAATAEERKGMLRLVVREVALDQKRERGLVWMRITWQTGATSEHRLRHSVQSYAQYASAAELERRIRALNAACMMDREIAAALNADGISTARNTPFVGENVHLCRKRWGIRTVKVNGADANPLRWPDGSYSVQGAAEALGVTAQTVFKWMRKGRLTGGSWPKASLGRSSCLMSRPPRLRLKYDGPNSQRGRHHEVLGNPTLADAILERFIHNAHRIELKGESLRKQRAVA